MRPQRSAEKKGFTQLSNEMLYTKVADEIRGYIERNDLQIGDKLPAERALAVSLGISRASVREGLRILELRGIITVRTGVGTFVSQSVSGPSMFINIVRINFLEMLEVKVTLEAAALRQAVHVLTEDRYEALEQIAKQMLLLHDLGVYDEQLDIRFHRMLIQDIPNQSLSHMVYEMIDLFTEYWRQITENPANSERVAKLYETLPMHQTLVEALRAGNIDEALRIHSRIFEIDVDILNSLDE